MSETNKPRQWTLTFATNSEGEEQTPVVTDGPIISGYEAEVKVIELAPMLKMMDDMAKGYQQLINIVSCAGEITPDRERYMNMQIITRAPEIAKDKLTVYKTFKKENGLDI